MLQHLFRPHCIDASIFRQNRDDSSSNPTLLNVAAATRERPVILLSGETSLSDIVTSPPFYKQHVLNQNVLTY